MEVFEKPHYSSFSQASKVDQSNLLKDAKHPPVLQKKSLLYQHMYIHVCMAKLMGFLVGNLCKHISIFDWSSQSQKELWSLNTSRDWYLDTLFEKIEELDPERKME